METNELMKSLERMKSVLTDIQSAKQQVESNVNAYEALSKKLNGVVDAVNNISDGLSDIVKNIKKDYQDRLNKIASESEKIVSSSNNSIKKLDDSITKFNETIDQKMREQEQYFIDAAKWQKRIIVLLFANIIFVLILFIKVLIE